jgi:hypothetical protein
LAASGLQLKARLEAVADSLDRIEEKILWGDGRLSAGSSPLTNSPWLDSVDHE